MVLSRSFVASSRPNNSQFTASNNALNIPFSKADNAWNEFVAKINRSLDKLDLEFRAVHDETTGRELYGLVGGHRFMFLGVYLKLLIRLTEKATKSLKSRQITHPQK